MTDEVNAPAHYNAGAIECIDAIEAALTPAEFIGYCKGNVIKYAWREGYKGHRSKDMHKSAWYADRAAKALEKIQ